MGSGIVMEGVLNRSFTTKQHIMKFCLLRLDGVTLSCILSFLCIRKTSSLILRDEQEASYFRIPWHGTQAQSFDQGKGRCQVQARGDGKETQPQSQTNCRDGQEK